MAYCSNCGHPLKEEASLTQLNSEVLTECVVDLRLVQSDADEKAVA